MKYTRKKTQAKFNEFIRMRDSVEWDFEYFECISCPPAKAMKPKRGRNMHAGHYHHFSVSSALTFDEVNINGQCNFCNRTSGANPEVFEGYKKGLIKRYGPGVVNYLDSKKKNKTHFDQVTLKALYDYYSQKIQELNSGTYILKQKYFK